MRTLLIFIIYLSATNASADPAADPSGLWNTFDKSGTLQSTVEVRIEAGKLYATILRLHNQPEENPVCENCKGDLYGKPVIGMEVINGLSLKKNIWQNGTLFDPETGGSYKGRVWLEENTLMVRGYLGFVYQTKSWQRAL
ncbi:MAG: DUF2147 domain-containing protein [Porticoccaceae bacterium]|mgnify:FL=1|nr:DUF2147 domain-containing protein [Porticoccaceae bacterium]